MRVHGNNGANDGYAEDIRRTLKTEKGGMKKHCAGKQYCCTGRSGGDNIRDGNIGAVATVERKRAGDRVGP